MSVTDFNYSAKTTEIDSLRFTEKDLDLVGTLEYGQFGVVRDFFSQYHYVEFTHANRSTS